MEGRAPSYLAVSLHKRDGHIIINVTLYITSVSVKFEANEQRAACHFAYLPLEASRDVT